MYEETGEVMSFSSGCAHGLTCTLWKTDGKIYRSKHFIVYKST